MFNAKLRAGLAAVFGFPAEENIEQERLANKIYYTVGNYDCKVIDGGGLLFRVPVLVELEYYDHNFAVYGVLTSRLHEYRLKPKLKEVQIEDLTYQEIPSRIDKTRRRVSKEVIYTVNIDYDEVTEVIKGIDLTFEGCSNV